MRRGPILFKNLNRQERKKNPHPPDSSHLHTEPFINNVFNSHTTNTTPAYHHRPPLNHHQSLLQRRRNHPLLVAGARAARANLPPRRACTQGLATTIHALVEQEGLQLGGLILVTKDIDDGAAMAFRSDRRRGHGRLTAVAAHVGHSEDVPLLQQRADECRVIGVGVGCRCWPACSVEELLGPDERQHFRHDWRGEAKAYGLAA